MAVTIIDTLAPKNNAFTTIVEVANVGDGSITETEFNYLTGLDANIQDQLDLKDALITVGTGLSRVANEISIEWLGIELLSDPGADRVMFWDETDNALKWLTMGNSIAITGTTLDAIQDIRTTATPEFAGLNITGGVQGDVLYHNGTSFTRLAAGTSGQMLQTKGASANPLWEGVYTTGFENKAASTLSLSTRTLTVGVVSGSFNIYSNGVRINKTGGASCATEIDNTVGLHYVYFDSSGVLQHSTDAWDIEGTGIPVCTIYWNGSVGAVSDERHSAKRNQAFHRWAHDTIGLRYETGLDMTYPTAGVSNKTQLMAGVVHDEDLELDITTAQGKLVRHFYETAAGTWTWANGVDNAGNDRPYLWNAATSRVQYPDIDGTPAYGLADADAGKYIIIWVYATTDVDRPLHLITQAKVQPYDNAAQARAAVPPTIIGILAPEMKLIYRWIFKGDGQFDSSQDYRMAASLPAGGVSGLIAGAVASSATTNIVATNVQSALEELDTEKMANPMVAVGDLIIGGTAGTPEHLHIGANDYVLTSDGTTASWEASAAGFANPMDAAGDLIVGGVAGAGAKLAVGTAGQVLTVVSGTPAWADSAGGAPGEAGGEIISPIQQFCTLMLATWRGQNVADSSFFEMSDGWMDALNTESGINLGASTNELYDATDFYWSTYTDTSVLNVTGTAGGERLGDVGGVEQRLAQSFVPASDLWIVNAKLLLSANAGSPSGTVTCTIETDNSNKPSGTLAHANATIAITPTASTTNTWTFPAYIKLTSGVKYWIVWRCANQSTNVGWSVEVDTANTYAGGSRLIESNGTWGAVSATDDLAAILTARAPNGLTLVSENLVPARAAPENARIWINLYDPCGSGVVLDTDILAYASRDDGSTWTQMPLQDRGATATTSSNNWGYRHLYGSADISGQPSGVQMVWKVVTATSRVLQIRGVGFSWDSDSVIALTNPMDGPGEIIYGGAAGVTTALAVGANSQVLTLVSGVPSWQDAGLSGDTYGVFQTLLETYRNAGRGITELMDGIVINGLSAGWSDTGAGSANFANDGTYGFQYPTGGNVLFAYQEWGDYQSTAVGDSSGTEYMQAQSFTLAGSSAIKGASIGIYSVMGGITDNITVRIETDNAGSPSGTLADANLTKSQAGVAAQWNNFTFATGATIAGGTYWLVVSVPAQSNDKLYRWSLTRTNPYSGGARKQSTNGGASWTQPSASDDFMFKVWAADTVAVDLTIICNPVALTKVPTHCKFMVLFSETNDALTVNTDLLLYASRDGSTFTQITATTFVGDPRWKIAYGKVDISGQPSGQLGRFKVVTANNKNVFIHGYAAQWS